MADEIFAFLFRLGKGCLNLRIQEFMARFFVGACFLVLVCQDGWASTGPGWSDSRSSARSSHEETSPLSPGSHNISVDLGQVFLIGDLTRYRDSLGAQVHYTYGVSDLFAFDTSAGYSQHSDGRYSMMSLLAGMRMNLAWYDKVIPYIITGMGFYRIYHQNIDPQAPAGNPTSVAPILFGVHLGPGVDLQLSKRFYFGAALTFYNTFGTAKLANNTEQGVGGLWTSFFLHVGTSF